VPRKRRSTGLRLHPSAFASADLLADSAAQILHQRHHPIEGLYAVGNAAAHNEYDVGYQAGHSLTSGMTFGYLAALHIRAGSNVLTPCYL
jgi:3-oxosteroid 1-dehydrogenase